MSQLRTNSIVPLDGLPVGASGGGIVQTAQVTTTGTDSTTSTTYTDVSGMSCLLYTSPSPRDRTRSRMPSSA